MMNTRLSRLAACAILAMVLASPRASAKTDDFDKALELYENGMYGSARDLFEKMPGDPLSADYAVLCAVKMDSQDCGRLVDAVDVAHPKTILNSEIHNEYAKLLYNEGNYSRAAEEFEKVNVKSLKRSSRGEYWFKRGFCCYNRDAFTEAEECFRNALDNSSEYDDASSFGIGCIKYNEKNFSDAAEWFEKSKENEQFSVLSEFYLVDCHFMMKDYAYVTENGEALYGEIPVERQEHLSRLLSESFLVQGNTAKAREYLGREDMSTMTSNDDDCFHAASVLYASGDWEGAVKYFSMMKEKSDSLGQVASYETGSSYIHLKNKVAAMDAFKNAADLNFDSSIKEDAYFNYAKLAFDLNGDDSAFHDYIARYGTSVKGEMIYSYLAMSALTKHDYAAAVEAYDNIDELDPKQQSNYMKANFLRADQLLKNGSYSAAVPYLKASSYYASSKSDQFYQLSRYELADTYYRIESYKDAMKIYQELYNLSALRGRKEGALIPYDIAYCNYKLKEYKDAAKWFDTYLKTGNSLARQDALTRRADCDFLLKNYKGAAECYRNLLKEFSSPDDIYPYYHLGVAYALTGEKYRRIEALSPVLDANSDSKYYDDALYELGRAYTDVGDSDHALEVFERLYGTSSNAIFRAKAMLGEGMAKRNAEDLEGALVCYKKVVKDMPNSEFSNDALMSIQSIYTSMKQPQKYLEYVEANGISTGTVDDTRQLYYSTAEQVYLAGNWSGAVASFTDYLRRYPEGKHTADAYYYMAASYKELGLKEKAREYYKTALDAGLSGSSAEFATMAYASLSYQIENYQEAYAAYFKLCSSTNASARGVDPFLGLMRSAYRGRMYEEAISACDNVLKMTTDAATVREAEYDKAKSYLATSQRDEAMKMFKKLAASPATAEGAEANVMLIQDLYDRGQFTDVENSVYDFAAKCGDQSYWLARAYIILGDSFAERGNIEQAVTTYQSIRDGYTPSEEGDDILETVERKLQSL